MKTITIILLLTNILYANNDCYSLENQDTYTNTLKVAKMYEFGSKKCNIKKDIIIAISKYSKAYNFKPNKELKEKIQKLKVLEFNKLKNSNPDLAKEILKQD
jgi:hypothetical protein